MDQLNPPVPPVSSVQSLTLGLTAGSLSIVLSPRATLSFDFCGRPVALYEDGFYLARGLGGGFVEKKWLPGGRHVRRLGPDACARAQQRIIHHLKQARGRAASLALSGEFYFYDRGRRAPMPVGEAERALDNLIAYNETGVGRDVGKFRSIYNPVGILPPDQYLSVVVQLAEGCAWNRCSFCSFYAGRPARVRSRAEILDHVHRVRDYFGPSLAGRCSVFLGDADAFSAPPEIMVWACETVSRVFPELVGARKGCMGGIHSFGEVRSLLQWSEADMARAKAAGLRRVTVGIETGAPDLRRWISKPGSPEDVQEAVGRLKRAGLDVNAVVLLGLGGRENAAAHTAGTAGLLARLPFGPRDIVYYSALEVEADSPYARRMAESGWAALSPEDIALQKAGIEEILSGAGRRLKSAVYDIREFIY